jgi:hypothetical protein
MNRSIKIALIAIIVVVIIAAIMFIIWALISKPEVIFRPGPTEPIAEEPAGLPTTGTGTGGVVVELPDQETEPIIAVSTSEEVEKQKVLNLSILFAERFGSFSNQGDFQNIKDVMPLMTSSLQDWAEGYIAQNQGVDSGAIYAGTSTKVVSPTIKSIDLTAGRAEINIDTQRIETRTGEEERIYFQTINVVLLKVGNDWLIDSAKWL